MNDELESAVWFISSRSNGQADRVEVAFLADVVATRDTKGRERATLVCAPQQWQAFVTSAAEGHFDNM
ncbi:DUF397 domain-containing protein [Streptomyces albus subsp. chlorinus]|uniref:DUF397 domain-containing protein n=1 Tax=Streptomyces albus TaxID=1888 RepID=UPI00156E0F35|nr:DUF397 domain-containing protein [Streptomyces albus subsp. chlorinus]